jgi:hypothetical protein
MTWTRHPTLVRFRENSVELRLGYNQDNYSSDLSQLANMIREQQNQISELQWCVAALLDCLEARGMMRLTKGLPPRDRHGEQADVKP